ncbi:P-loop containing nucleoside triphosphate hydrolase protein [Lineolata rhizophorae]|uniref:Thymidylate kinase n=1 Tax=Lineolata rhizophorae TaxID=578093 RepID=A0A6A6NVU4_9PEZI|nr:P-loop containing nucleoside triphosphate hydrolase protein [Lineolata rhizophorae]
MARGKLIVFEGLDRSGKSSQSLRLVEKLEADGHHVLHMRFPDRTTPIGRLIDAYLKGESNQDDHVIHLLFSANRWEASSTIHSHLAANTTVVLDRYFYSGIAYTHAKSLLSSTSSPSPPPSPLTLDWCTSPDVGLPRPDLTLFLDLTLEEAARRGGYGGERYEKREMQERVREVFGRVWMGEGDAGRKAGEFVRVDAGKGMEEVEEEVWMNVRDMWESVEREGKGVGVFEMK